MTSFKLDDVRPCMTQRSGTGVSRMKQIYASRLKRQAALRRKMQADMENQLHENTPPIGISSYGKLQGMSDFFDPKTFERTAIRSSKAYVKGFSYHAPCQGQEACAIRCEGATMEVTLLTPVKTDAETVGSFIRSCDRREGLGQRVRTDPFADQEPLGPNLYGKAFVPAYDIRTHVVVGRYCLYYKCR